MMLRTSILQAFVFILPCPVSVLADNEADSEGLNRRSAETWEYYFGISGGWAEHDTFPTAPEVVGPSITPLSPRTITTSVDEDTASRRLAAGTFVNTYFGMEVSYVNFGSSTSRYTERYLAPSI